MANSPARQESPLSFAQQRLWFVSKLDPGALSYNLPFCFRFRGVLDVTALAHSYGEIVRRHAALRTTYPEVGGQPVQRVTVELPVELPVDVREGLPEDARAPAIEDWAQHEARRPFDLEHGPMLRVRLLRLAADDHALVQVMHHIACDGWSFVVLFREIGLFYRSFVGRTPPAVPALPIEYSDYAVWQRETLQGRVVEDQLAYWTQQLAGAPPVLELPTDRPRPAVRRSQGACVRATIVPDAVRALRELCARERVTPFIVLFAAYSALLSRYSGQSDLVIGSVIAGRNHRQLELLIGFFVNAVALRVKASPELSFRELLQRVRDTSAGAHAHQDLPFERLVDAIKPERSLGHTPVFQVEFVLQNAPSVGPALPGISVSTIDIDLGTARHDLSVTAWETPAGVVTTWNYDVDLFDEATVLRMARHYVRLLEAVVADPGRRLEELELLDAEERHTLVVAWNPPQGEAEASITAFPHEVFERQARETPEARAAVDGTTALSYRELDRRANQLAWQLRALGAGPDQVVAICLDRSVDMLVSVLAVLKAGAAYLPLDPGNPGARLQYTLEDSAATILIVHDRHEAIRPLVADAMARGARIVRLDRDALASGGRYDEAPEHRATADNLGYVIYTSGSTGQPKGAELRLGGLASLVRDMIGRLALGRDDTWVAVTTLSFDIATLEMLGPVCSGGTVVIATREQATRGDELCALLASSSCTVFQGTPSTYRLLLEAGLSRHALGVTRWVAGGERVAVDLLERVVACGGRFYNGYGPTETTIYSTMGELAPPTITIGQPVANTQVYILGRAQEPQPIGVIGEIYLGGGGLARGYRRRAGLTADRFVPDPFSGRAGARMYRTGDLGRRRADGRIECLGRTDDQVKVRGHRIELAEVEMVVRRHPGVAGCAAAVREDVAGDVRLIAYVVPRDGVVAPATSELRELVRGSLPESMMPSRFVALAALPMTSSGKVDRKALPAPDAERDAMHFVEPGTGLEVALAEIWADVLRLTRVGTADNFFDLGGNSLLLQSVHTRIEALVGRRIPLVELFEFSTIGALAAHLASDRSGPEDPAPPDLDPGSHGDDRRRALRQLASKRRGRDASR